ncbi:1-deoxy-D-xylulose-5-phosphate synthase N-terminal domain-containing protein [Reyranella sp.]
MRNLSTEQLNDLAADLRTETVDAVSVIGGHFRSRGQTDGGATRSVR